MQTLHPGDAGGDVGALHQQLAERGSLPPEAAHEVAAHLYGPVTAGAVATLQSKHGLVADGICGPRAWDALANGGDEGGARSPIDVAAAGPLGRTALIVAEELVAAHVAEEPLGSNRGPVVDRILVGLDGRGGDLLCYRRYAGNTCTHCDGEDAPTPECGGAPWCGRHAKYCFDVAAQRLGVASPIAGWGDLASVGKWRDAAQLRRALTTSPAPGRVGLIMVPAQAGHAPHGHVILVAGPVGPDGLFPTREGNSGQRAAARRRSPLECTGGFVELG